MRRIGLAAEHNLAYADSSALVKLVIEEPESEGLERHLAGGQALISSRLAAIEVPRACRLANPAAEVEQDVERLLGAVMLLDVTSAVIDLGAALASGSLRTLDALHLASAISTEPDEVIAYDRQLLEAASMRGLRVASPGS